MYEAGCRSIFFGIESSNQEVLKLIGKGFTLKQARKAISWVHEAGIQVHTSFIIGLPGDTYQSTLNIAKFVEQVRADKVLYNILIAYPGSKLFNEPDKYGIVDFSLDWSLSEQARPMVRTDKMDENDIRRAYIYLISHLHEMEARGSASVLGTYK
jgi:anaerobic magnesium-protoporphyrin IX monomethyl ester cyclase